MKIESKLNIKILVSMKFNRILEVYEKYSNLYQELIKRPLDKEQAAKIINQLFSSQIESLGTRPHEI